MPLSGWSDKDAPKHMDFVQRRRGWYRKHPGWAGKPLGPLRGARDPQRGDFPGQKSTSQQDGSCLLYTSPSPRD
eukprot:9420676-Alexandrium_andersonii.AAC.1